MARQQQDYTFTNFKLYVPYKSIASSSSCSEREESVSLEGRDDGDESWSRYQREDRGVERNVVRVKDSRVLKKYVLRRFPMMLRMREEMFMEKVGRYEIDSGQDIPDIYEKYYTTAKYAYNHRIKAFNKRLPKLAQTICQQQFSCPICLQAMVLPVVTSCGHSFCFQCIDQHTLFSINCPNCRSDIRDNDFHIDQTLNKLLLLVYSKRQQQTQKIYKQRHTAALQNLKTRTAPILSLKIGDLLDIRDTEMIWCKGQIMDIYYNYSIQTNTNQITAILVHYQRWHSLYDEVIRMPTSRLANYQYFTTRDEISRYHLNSNLDNMQGMVERGFTRPVEQVVQSQSDEQEVQSDNDEDTVEIEQSDFARGINLHRRVGPSRLIYQDSREVSHHRNIFPYQIHFYYQFDDGNTRATYVLQANGSNASIGVSRRNTEEDQEESVENGNANQEPV